MPTLDFHYDISCPFAYIASLLLPALSTRHPTLSITYKPVLLGALYRETKAPQGSGGSASDVFVSLPFFFYDVRGCGVVRYELG